MVTIGLISYISSPGCLKERAISDKSPFEDYGGRKLGFTLKGMQQKCCFILFSITSLCSLLRVSAFLCKATSFSSTYKSIETNLRFQLLLEKPLRSLSFEGLPACLPSQQDEYKCGCFILKPSICLSREVHVPNPRAVCEGLPTACVFLSAAVLPVSSTHVTRTMLDFRFSSCVCQVKFMFEDAIRNGNNQGCDGILGWSWR